MSMTAVGVAIIGSMILGELRAGRSRLKRQEIDAILRAYESAKINQAEAINRLTAGIESSREMENKIRQHLSQMVRGHARSHQEQEAHKLAEQRREKEREVEARRSHLYQKEIRHAQIQRTET